MSFKTRKIDMENCFNTTHQTNFSSVAKQQNLLTSEQV
jgi:hypothetical protein